MSIDENEIDIDEFYREVQKAMSSFMIMYDKADRETTGIKTTLFLGDWLEQFIDYCGYYKTIGVDSDGKPQDIT